MTKSLSLYLCLVLISVFNVFGNIDSAALKIDNYKKNDTIKVEMMVDYCVANTFSISDQMLTYATQAFKLSKQLNYKIGEIRALNCLGNYYYQQAIYDKAISFYTKALTLAEKKADIKNIVIGKSNLASLYTRNKQPDKALKMFKDADSLLVKSGESFSQNRAAILTNTGALYSSIGQHLQAINLHTKVLQICEKLNIPFGIALAKSNIGEEYVYLKNYNAAIGYLQPALAVCLAHNLNNLVSNVYKNLGRAYELKKDNTKALFYFNKAVLIAKQTNNQNTLLTASQKLHEIYAIKGDFKNAYQLALLFLNVNDSINGNVKQKAIAEINTKYETEKKEATIKALSQNKQIAELKSKQKNILIFSLIGAFITIALLGYFLFSRYKINKKNELLNAKLLAAEKLLASEKKVTDSEIKALKSQMNPHFIFNALNGIQQQFMYGDKLVANEQMSNFTYLTRQILEVSGKKNITLSTEIEIITKYLELEKMRFQKDFFYDITVYPNIDDEYLRLPPMLLQPFIENSIKHGLMHKEGLKKLHINFELSDNEEYLLVKITDNGIGRKKSEEIKSQQILQHNSFSSEAISQRLQLIAKNNTDDLMVYIDLFNDEKQSSGTQLLVKIYLG
ncbi:tetratricopeptide repeat-containing sensor histidine kinase [Pedobacter alpinus]|uniref:Tetratricopeptide repeat protein n=1 Tax=Pedobacter alpinus TaxID=1590643 RepID=A0ABW5TRQ3_9SPHI